MAVCVWHATVAVYVLSPRLGVNCAGIVDILTFDASSAPINLTLQQASTPLPLQSHAIMYCISFSATRPCECWPAVASRGPSISHSNTARAFPSIPGQFLLSVLP